jgi:serine/threonine protein kinase
MVGVPCSARGAVTPGEGEDEVSSSVPPPRAKKADPLVGEVINGKYKVIALVAAGGMGKIYRAEQMPLGRPVALKVLHAKTDSEGDDDLHFKKRFFREASILARLQHPNIVTIFDYGLIEGIETERYFISMEFCAGESLARRIAERVSLATRDTIRIARQIARALTEAHAHGVIHRDLKPSNVMLLAGRDGEEHVKIVDFGIVKIVGDDSHEGEELTEEGSFIGSPKYMAPEQISRGGKIDVRTDVYSFGVILYQCLTGTVPFEASSTIQTLMAHLNQVPDPIRARAPSSDVPDWLDQLVVSCMEKDPERRPQTMEAVARTLAEADAAYNSGRILADMNPRNSSSALTATTGTGQAIERAPSGSSPRQASGGQTTQGTIASIHPAAESEHTRTSPGQKKEAPPRRASLVPLAGAAVVVLVAGGVLLLYPPQSPAPAPASSPVASQAPGPAAYFALRIESVPPGANVREGDRVLGTTPLDLSIDNGTARRAPRSLTVTKDGYSTYALVQGPSEDDVHVVAALAPLPAAAASSVAAHASAAPPPPRRPGAPPRGAGTTAPRSDLDIRLNR